MSRYEALTEYLEETAEDKVVLSFDQFDELAGRLPPSARRHAPWWGNSKKPTSQSCYPGPAQQTDQRLNSLLFSSGELWNRHGRRPDGGAARWR